MAHSATAESAARTARRSRTQPLAAHLRELRRRALVAAAAVVVAAVAGWVVTDPVLRMLDAPLAAVAGQHGSLAALNFDTVTGAFELRVRLAVQLGLILSAPVWLYQLLAFIVPGLTRRESRYVVGFLAAALPLFAVGAAAGAFVFPHIVAMMLSFAPEQSASLMQAGSYYDFALRLMLTTGVAFVLPVVLVLLNAVGVLSARAVLRGWRWAIAAICVFTALATPAADVMGMLLLAAPMVALYFAAVGVCFLGDRRRARRAVAAA